MAHLRDPALVAVGQARVDRVVRVEGREVLQVDVPGRGEVGRDGDPEQAGLDLAVDLVSGPAVAVDRQDPGPRDAAVDSAVGRGRIPDVDVAAADADVAVGEVEDPGARGLPDHRAALGVGPAVGAADVDRPAVGRQRDAVGLAGVREVAAGAVDQPLAGVVGRDRRLAAAAHEAGAPLDRAQQMGAEVGLGVRGRGAAHAGVEGAAALEVATPGDRPVGAAGGRAVARGRVRGVVARDGVDLAGRPRGPLVPDVAAGPLERESTGRRVHAVADGDDLLGGAGRAARRRARADQAGDERAGRSRPRRRSRCRRSHRRPGCRPAARPPARRSGGHRRC